MSECEVMRFFTLERRPLDSEEAAEPDSLDDSFESAEPMENSDESLRPAFFLGALNIVAHGWVCY